jgi:hypothetical protein
MEREEERERERESRRTVPGSMKKLELYHIGIRPIDAIYGRLQASYIPPSDRRAMGLRRRPAVCPFEGTIYHLQVHKVQSSNLGSFGAETSLRNADSVGREPLL